MSALVRPHRRIADSIRRRIDSGELVAGDRIPSTRELARTWGVAPATAAHALRTLVHAGVVRAVPRIGTVVAGPRRKSEPEGGELGVARIVEAAIAIADAEGLAALSLRGVAGKLGAPVMSLYRHVPSKEALLDRMTDAALGEDPLPRERPAGWRPAIELAARRSWASLKRHPWLARTLVLSRPRPLPNAIAYADWILGALEGHGLAAPMRMNLHILLHAFVLGLGVDLEAEAEAQAATGMGHDEWIDTQLASFDALAATGRYPAFARTLAELDEGFDLRLDGLFEQGLGAVLDGFARIIERAKPASARLTSSRSARSGGPRAPAARG
jgi:DNA-binding transcriptional regulator YhcF (GntR family)